MRNEARAALLVILALTLVGAVAPEARADGSDEEVLIVRYAFLVGERQPDSVPVSGEILSQPELTDLLLAWNPDSDNREIRQAFALNELGELARQASVLSLDGGEVSGVYLHGGVRYEVSLNVRLSGASGDSFTVTSDFRADGEALSSPQIQAPLGRRSILSTFDGSGGRLLFLVVEMNRMTRDELQRRGLRHSWNPDLMLVDGETVLPPVAIEKAPPQYTEEARVAKQQGKVILRLVIDETGRVADVEVLEGQPYGLTENAVEAVRGWRFEPARYQDEAVGVLYIVTVNFRLE